MERRFPSLRGALASFLKGVDDPSARVARGGRLAALGFIAGALTAYPVNFMLTGTSLYEHTLATLVLALGIACLMIEWDEKRPITLYLIATSALVIIAAASILSTPAFALTYFFVALVMAFAAPFRVMMLAIGLITVGLFLPAVVGPNAGVHTLAFAMVFAPTVLVMSLLAYQLTRLLEQSRQSFWAMSRQDPLTGVGNYRALHERLEQEIGRHSRRLRGFSVVVLDLDDFKSVNDGYGHLFGDRVLTEIAGAIRGSIRKEDTVFRQGGDEFAIVAPETVGNDLALVVDRVKRAVADCRPSQEIQLSVSSGVASFPDDGTTSEALIGAADDRLMDRKRTEARDSTPGAPAA